MYSEAGHHTQKIKKCRNSLRLFMTVTALTLFFLKLINSCRKQEQKKIKLQKRKENSAPLI